MKRKLFKSILLGAAVAVSLAAIGQPSGGPGGPGMGKGMGMGMGMSAAPHMGPQTTPGWGMMTPEERTEQQAKMHTFKDKAECQAYMAAHHALMQARAKERGMTMPSPGPGFATACNYMTPGTK